MAAAHTSTAVPYGLRSVVLPLELLRICGIVCHHTQYLSDLTRKDNLCVFKGDRKDDLASGAK